VEKLLKSAAAPRLHRCSVRGFSAAKPSGKATSEVRSPDDRATVERLCAQSRSAILNVANVVAPGDPREPGDYSFLGWKHGLTASATSNNTRARRTALTQGRDRPGWRKTQRQRGPPRARGPDARGAPRPRGSALRCNGPGARGGPRHPREKPLGRSCSRPHVMVRQRATRAQTRSCGPRSGSRPRCRCAWPARCLRPQPAQGAICPPER